MKPSRRSALFFGCSIGIDGNFGAIDVYHSRSYSRWENWKPSWWRSRDGWQSPIHGPTENDKYIYFFEIKPTLEKMTFCTQNNLFLRIKHPFMHNIMYVITWGNSSSSRNISMQLGMNRGMLQTTNTTTMKMEARVYCASRFLYSASWCPWHPAPRWMFPNDKFVDWREKEWPRPLPLPDDSKVAWLYHWLRIIR